MRLVFAGWMSMVVFCSGISGMVLCVGEDGHIALKADHAGHGLPSHDDHHAHEGPALVAADCGGHECVDVALASDHALPLVLKINPAPRRNTTQTDLLPVPQLLAGAMGSCAGPSWLPCRVKTGLSSLLEAQRTTVLRT